MAEMGNELAPIENQGNDDADLTQPSFPKWAAAVLAVAGVGLAWVLFNYFGFGAPSTSPDKPTPPTPVASSQTPPASPPTDKSIQSPYVSPTQPVAKAGPPKQAPSANPPKPGMKGTPPPPNGPISPMLDITPLPTVGPPTKPAATQAVQGRLLWAVAQSVDPAKAASSAIDLAQGSGGGASRFLEYDAQGHGSPSLLVWIPADHAETYLAKLGATPDNEWEGDASERRSRLTTPVKGRIYELRRKREDLLIRYVETAPAVKEVDEDIAFAQSTLDALNNAKAPDNMTLIKVSFTAR